LEEEKVEGGFISQGGCLKGGMNEEDGVNFDSRLRKK